MMNLQELLDLFPNEDACKRFLVEQRWPTGKPSCPRCQATERVYKRGGSWRWVCKNCHKSGYGFSPLTGTVFEDTKMPLRQWFIVAFLMLHSKKGMSARQIHRTVFTKRTSYETVWYMCQRIRGAMMNDEFAKLSGTIEMDETYIGGKERNKHKSKRLNPGGGTHGKIGVIGAIARKGSVAARVIEKMDFRTAQRFVRDTVADDVSLVATDQHQTYKFMWFGENAKHETVNHSKGEYVRGVVHTANLDAFWSLLKRGIIGTFHNVSHKYLPLYVNEFTFRHNHREDADMFGALIRGC